MRSRHSSHRLQRNAPFATPWVSVARPRRALAMISSGLLVPDEVLRIIVSVLCPDLDGFDKVRDRREHAAAETPLGQLQLVIIRS